MHDLTQAILQYSLKELCSEKLNMWGMCVASSWAL